MTKCNGINDDGSVRYWLSGRGAGYGGDEAMAQHGPGCPLSFFSVLGAKHQGPILAAYPSFFSFNNIQK